MTSHSRCAKDSASCDTKFFYANVGCWRRCGWRIAVYVWLENCCLRVVGELPTCGWRIAVFSVSYFLNVLEEFRSCLSKPEGSVCQFRTFYVDPLWSRCLAAIEPTDPLWSQNKQTKWCCLAAIEPTDPLWSKNKQTKQCSLAAIEPTDPLCLYLAAIEPTDP